MSYDKYEFIGSVCRYTFFLIASIWLTVFVCIIFFIFPVQVWPEDLFFQFMAIGWMFIGISMFASSLYILITCYQKLRSAWVLYSREYFLDKKGSFGDLEVLPPWERGLIVLGKYLLKEY